jgi:hypothetical protein
LATAAWVWFQAEGFHAEVEWQEAQLEAVGMWVEDLPVAEEPLWQEEQLVAAVKRVWSGLAPAHVEVDLWQLSQAVWPLWMGVEGRAVRPKEELKWQEAH